MQITIDRNESGAPIVREADGAEIDPIEILDHIIVECYVDRNGKFVIVLSDHTFLEGKNAE
jgi:hypothetical protein